MQVTKEELEQLYEIFSSFKEIRDTLPQDDKLRLFLNETIKLRADVEKLKAKQTPDGSS